MHETIWNPKATRKAAPTRHRAAAKWLHSVGRSEEARLFTGFGVRLAQDVPGRRRGSFEAKAGAGTSPKDDARPEANIDATSTKRASFTWVQYRPMDPKARCRGNREKVWDKVPPQSPLAFSNGSGLELSEAPKESPGTRRKSHTALETLRMAAYKKTLIESAPISYFLTKAASFWFPISDAHGRRVDKPHICPWQAIGRRYRLFRPSAYPLKEDVLHCIPDSIPVETSKRRRLSDFCIIFCVILRVLSFSCGIRAWFIGLAWLRSASGAIKELKLISFPAMLLNLIPLNSYGRNLKGLPPTLFRRIWFTLKMSCVRPYAGFAIHSVSCGHAYGPRICHGDRMFVTYA